MCFEVRMASPTTGHKPDSEMNIYKQWSSLWLDFNTMILIFSTSRFHVTVAAIYLEILNAFFLEEDWYPDLLKWIPNLKRWCTNRILSILFTKFTLATKFTLEMNYQMWNLYQETIYLPGPSCSMAGLLDPVDIFIQWIAWFVLLTLIHWIAIYLGGG